MPVRWPCDFCTLASKEGTEHEVEQNNGVDMVWCPTLSLFVRSAAALNAYWHRNGGCKVDKH